MMMILGRTCTRCVPTFACHTFFFFWTRLRTLNGDSTFVTRRFLFLLLRKVKNTDRKRNIIGNTFDFSRNCERWHWRSDDWQYRTAYRSRENVYCIWSMIKKKREKKGTDVRRLKINFSLLERGWNVIASTAPTISTHTDPLWHLIELS